MLQLVPYNIIVTANPFLARERDDNHGRSLEKRRGASPRGARETERASLNEKRATGVNETMAGHVSTNGRGGEEPTSTSTILG